MNITVTHSLSAPGVTLDVVWIVECGSYNQGPCRIHSLTAARVCDNVQPSTARLCSFFLYWGRKDQIIMHALLKGQIFSEGSNLHVVN